jgi:hypothetical protein
MALLHMLRDPIFFFMHSGFDSPEEERARAGLKAALEVAAGPTGNVSAVSR